MTKFALLIGTNYPNTDISLNSPLNNILYVKNQLLKYDFNNENMLLLNDTSSKYTNSTHHNIITLINAIAIRSNPGDLLFIYFNGYNSITNNKDEIYCPTDYENPILFKELYNVLKKNKGNNFILSDCQNSKKVTYLKYNFYPNNTLVENLKMNVDDFRLSMIYNHYDEEHETKIFEKKTFIDGKTDYFSLFTIHFFILLDRNKDITFTDYINKLSRESGISNSIVGFNKQLLEEDKFFEEYDIPDMDEKRETQNTIIYLKNIVRQKAKDIRKLQKIINKRK